MRAVCFPKLFWVSVWLRVPKMRRKIFGWLILFKLFSAAWDSAEPEKIRRRRGAYPKFLARRLAAQGLLFPCIKCERCKRFAVKCVSTYNFTRRVHILYWQSTINFYNHDHSYYPFLCVYFGRFVNIGDNTLFWQHNIDRY